MNKRPITDAKSPTLRGSLKALRRAAQRERVIAAQTGTALVVRRNGVIEHIRPEPENAKTPKP